MNVGGFNGTVSERNLYVLRNTQPAGVYLELGNIRNSRDQQRLVLENNRQALAKWIAEAIVADYKGKKWEYGGLKYEDNWIKAIFALVKNNNNL